MPRNPETGAHRRDDQQAGHDPHRELALAVPVRFSKLGRLTVDTQGIW